ncbi:epoxyqueuosine reductase QueH [bacterium]|nr:epoxyqueuosine reductase QueH [bacterium]
MLPEKQKMLLHVCCAPCSTVALERLQEDYAVTVFFFNPNIHPKIERNKRLEEMQRLADDLGFEVLSEEYAAKEWFDLMRGMEDLPEGGERCTRCFEMRLRKTAEIVREKGFDIFATSLTLSPHKDAERINRLGHDIAVELGVGYYESNFKKMNGYQQSIKLSHEYNLYRQDYCGCIFSKKEREQQKAARAAQNRTS